MKFTIKRPSSLAGFVLAVISLFVLVPMAVHGQELRGKITGRVMDPNGAAVPGANVKVTDVTRNKTVDLTTNSEGLFEAPYLLPGTYQVLVEMTGFKKAVRSGVLPTTGSSKNPLGRRASKDWIRPRLDRRAGARRSRVAQGSGTEMPRVCCKAEPARRSRHPRRRVGPPHGPSGTARRVLRA